MRTLDELNPVFVIIDSIQTVFSPDAGMVPGTVNQLKLCSQELVSWVKERDAVLFLVAHITKDGTIAGPKALEHLVDTVLSFERNEEDIRFLRAQKNRFGSVDELGIFQMTAEGLLAVQDPSSLYSGMIDSSRVSRVAAVLEKRVGLRFSDQDIYVNVAGGVRLAESAVDAALAAALYSARTDIPSPQSTVLIGELSLAGEIRPVGKLKPRVKAAKTLCFSRVIAPAAEEGSESVTDIRSLVSLVFGGKGKP
jgi:DNA repair protein RadA/Sms